MAALSGMGHTWRALLAVFLAATALFWAAGVSLAAPGDASPGLVWSTYLGGSGSDSGGGIAVDHNGDILVTGSTTSSDFPVQGDGQVTYGGNRDVFVAKISPTGELIWASYLGGSGDDSRYRARDDRGGWGGGIAVDASGNAWVTGRTNSTDFPVPGGFQTSLAGHYDAFVARLAPDGTLAWASYLGGSTNDDHARVIAVDGSGNAWVTGSTFSSDFPTANGFQTALSGQNDAFISEITAQGNLAWSTYLGGEDYDWGTGITTDAGGNAWVTIYSQGGVPTPGGFDTTCDGPGDAYVAKITPGHLIAWASYLGGNDEDWSSSIAVDSAGSVWVTGYTHSTDFPSTGGFQTSLAGAQNAFVTKISSDGVLEWSSYLGGSEYDFSHGIAIDPQGNGWVAGGTYSSDFGTPGTSGEDASSGSVFVARIAPAGALTWVKTFGGSGDDQANGIAVDASGAAWLTGDTTSSDLPTPGGFDTTYGGGEDGRDALVMCISAELSWLQIDKFHLGLPASTGHDSFVLEGSCNMWPYKTAPQTVTLNVGTTWSVTMDSASWKKVGKAGTYTCKANGVVAKLTYWSGLSTKCLFSFTASKQILKDSLPDLQNVPVRLRIGSGFDETVPVRLTLKGHTAKLASVGPQPVFWIDKVTLTRKLSASGRDSLLFKGRLFLQDAIDPETDAVTMTIGPYAISIPAGSFTESRNGLKYTAATPHGKLKVQLNTATGVLSVTATGIDLSTATDMADVSLSITNHDGTDWDYGLVMGVNKTANVYKY